MLCAQIAELDAALTTKLDQEFGHCDEKLHSGQVTIGANQATKQALEERNKVSAVVNWRMACRSWPRLSVTCASGWLSISMWAFAQRLVLLCVWLSRCVSGHVHLLSPHQQSSPHTITHSNSQ